MERPKFWHEHNWDPSFWGLALRTYFFLGGNTTKSFHGFGIQKYNRYFVDVYMLHIDTHIYILYIYMGGSLWERLETWNTLKIAKINAHYISHALLTLWDSAWFGQEEHAWFFWGSLNETHFGLIKQAANVAGKFAVFPLTVLQMYGKFEVFPRKNSECMNFGLVSHISWPLCSNSLSKSRLGYIGSSWFPCWEHRTFPISMWLNGSEE